MIHEIKELISDLKYEPFEAFLSRRDIQVYDDIQNERVIITNLRNYEDKKDFCGQCEELTFIAARRIKSRFPLARIKIWSGHDTIYFTRRDSLHIYLTVEVKHGIFGKEVLVVDPSFQVVDYEKFTNYKRKDLMFDSNKHNGIQAYIDSELTYGTTTPVYLDSASSNLFFVFYNSTDSRFYIYLNDKIFTPDEAKHKTNNRRFKFFCDKLESFLPVKKSFDNSEIKFIDFEI